MIAGWVAVSAALIYLMILFGVAYYGDTKGRFLLEGRLRPTIYAFALAVYCTSWTFLGSVGLASRNGLDFLPIYLGPLHRHPARPADYCARHPYRACTASHPSRISSARATARA